MKKMDYTIGLEAGRAGQKWTATALTDRAKERTPEPVMFAGRPEALKFLKDSQAEGYRFSGAELVDPEQRLVKNRYFVIGGDGQLTLSGEDNGPRDTVWEIGDVMPGRDRSMGTEAIVENILQGPGVRERFGCDLAFLLRLHVVAQGTLAVSSIPPFDPAKPCPCGLHGKSYGDCCKDKGVHALGNEMLRGTAPRMVPGALSQIQSSMVNAKMIPGFGLSGTKSGTTHSTKRSISSLMRLCSGRSARNGLNSNFFFHSRIKTRLSNGARRWLSCFAGRETQTTVLALAILSLARRKPTSVLATICIGFNWSTGCPSPSSRD